MEINKIRQQRLKDLVDSIGLAEFCERTGRSKSQISNITTGWRNLGEKLARDLEQALGLPSGYFDKPDDDNTNIGQAILDRVRVPLVSWESLLGDDNGISEEVIMANSKTPANARALTIVDRSMEPLFGLNDVVLFVPDRNPQPSNYVVAIADGKVVLRKFRATTKDDFELIPLNEDYATLSSQHSEIQIKGVVIELRKTLDN